MILHTFIDKANTIIKNSNVNTGLNPVSELYYGLDEQYTRLLLHFDETRLKELYTGNTFTDLTKLKHVLHLTNATSTDVELLNGFMGGKQRTSSFDLIAFKINQDWDNGVGYDYAMCGILNGCCAFSNGPSNWVEPKTGFFWDNGTGVYSGSPSGITISTQHFDKGNENLEMDITDYVNGLLTGDTNYGIGIAFTRGLELSTTDKLEYVGFFTHNTQTIFEPYVETIYSNHISDDRFDFYLDKPNKLYLYVNLLGNPTNLDTMPSVSVYDEQGLLFSAFTGTQINHVTKGVYSIDLTVPTTSTNDCTMYNDVWSGIVINGVSRPDISLDFALKNSMGYYNIGGSNSTPKKIAVSISGIQNQEKIKRGDVRKVFVTPKIPYTVNQTQVIDNIKYRIFTLEGSSELTIIDYHPVELATPNPYFILDTLSFLSGTYYIDIMVESNLEKTSLQNVCKFIIINEVENRIRF